jgi:Ca-activated chloride channel homolog
MMELHLMRPQWLWTLLPALLLLLLLWRQRSRNGSWQSVIVPDLLRYLVSGSGASRGVNLLPVVFLGWLLAALAASGPSWQKLPQPVHQKQDALVILLDLSYSMKSADLAPSRLERARQKLLDLLQQRREGQTALIAYAGDAHIVTPLTDDTPTIANLLPALHPDMMPLPGSEPVSAVTQALELLRSAGIRQGKLLLVTDGVSEKDREGIEKVMAGSDSQLTIMGVGTPSGAPIPLPNGGFLKDDAGTIIMPGLDEENLRELASAAGGNYRRMQLDDSDLRDLLTGNPMSDTGETLALDRTADTWEDQGYLLILALLPLALGLFRRGWLLALLPVLLLVQPAPATAQTWEDLWFTPDQQGQRALQQGNNEAAATLFENPEWAGTAAYNNSDYETAIEHFNDPVNADSLYNRGNALARAGQLDKAITAYEQSLQQQPDRADARENLELVKQLQEQQQQNQNQNENQNQDQDQQEEQQEQNQQQNQNQDQDQDQDQQDKQQPNQKQNQQQNSKQNPQDAQQPDGGKNAQPDQAQDAPKQEQNSESQQQRAESQQEKEDADAAAGTTRDEETQKEPVDGKARSEADNTEHDQAMEQWLRRVPDDPSGLLRQKFRYESLQRQEQGVGRDDEAY